MSDPDVAAYEVTVEDDLSSPDVTAIEIGLALDGESKAGARNKRVLVAIARDRAGRAVGGIRGDTVWGWLQIHQLWVWPHHRGRGVGTALVVAAEQEAQRRGCTSAWVDTFDFQAPDFYKRLGYQLFGTLPNFPVGHTRYFLKKDVI